MADLAGKVALITGGGTGIGAAIAQVFAAEGAAVAITGRRPEPLAEIAARITAAGGTALSAPADVTDLDAMQRAADATVERFGRSTSSSRTRVSLRRWRLRSTSRSTSGARSSRST